ncbi:glutathione synthase [Phellopilus nigrolimitatus]|nr:glutathione synthase [Phellopilus nigrolimitatus]
MASDPDPFVFADWPPALSDEQRAELTRLATTYALAHGLLYLPLPDPAAPPAPAPAAAPQSAIHAPLALLPAPFPRALFAGARRLQRVYNVLYARVALDAPFLDAVMGALADVDDFTAQLWRSWRRLRDDAGIPEPLHLGLFRSDYLLHDVPGAPLALKQVEFNTISSSFGALAERVSGLHNYLLAATDYYGCSPHLARANLPPNRTTATLAAGLAAAHRAYGVTGAHILFVVQPGERNVFDQRWLEYELLEKHAIRVVRQTFAELRTSAALAPDRTLTVPAPGLPAPVEIAVVYYRAGYTPADYDGAADYAVRERLSRARAVNCPTLALQLAGGKKVQEVLARPGVLERFLLPAGIGGGSGDEGFGPETFTPADVAAVRASWVDMWALDAPGGAARAQEDAAALVLKPQREGGGNNRERAAWIAMALIAPPAGTGGYLVRAGGEEARRAEVVSELGVFGWALGIQVDGEGEEGEEGGAWLVRTKGRESDEGGVAVGFSVLDSVLLVD